MSAAQPQHRGPLHDQDGMGDYTVAERIELRLRDLDRRLNLTDDQQIAIRKIWTDFSNQKMTCQERFDARESIHEKVKAVLNEGQRSLYERYGYGENCRGPRHEGSHGPRHHDCPRR